MNPHNSDPAALIQEGLLPATSEAGNHGSSLDDRGQEGNIEELSYNPVPPRNTVIVSVRYRTRRRGRPLAYPLDEGDGE